MKYNKGKIIGIVVVIILLISVGITSNAHSGRTDANGGHKDNKNKSGLGSYHYHCGGNPAHLHSNGVCPYAKTSTKQKSSSNSNQKVTKSNTSTTTKQQETPKTIGVENIKINSTKKELQIGEEIALTAEILPSNASNKNMSWKSKNETIATVDKEGRVKAITSGTVEIVATSNNGKTDSLEITIKETKQPQPSLIENKTNTVATASSIPEQQKEKDTVSTTMIGLVGIVVLSGCGYLVYKKIKK